VIHKERANLAFLLHAPSHVVEAARIAGHPSDTFVEEKKEPNPSAQTTPGLRLSVSDL
jgi:hypothetical protein